MTRPTILSRLRVGDAIGPVVQELVRPVTDLGRQGQLGPTVCYAALSVPSDHAARLETVDQAGHEALGGLCVAVLLGDVEYTPVEAPTATLTTSSVSPPIARKGEPHRFHRRLRSEYGWSLWNETAERTAIHLRPASARFEWFWRTREVTRTGRLRSGRLRRRSDAAVESLRRWVAQSEIDAGSLDGVTSEGRARIRDLEREVRELRQANEILKKASAYFAPAFAHR